MCPVQCVTYVSGRSPEVLRFPVGTKRHKVGTLDESPPRQSSRFLRFSWEQKRDQGLLRIALFGRECLRIRIECHANRGVTQQLLHGL